MTNFFVIVMDTRGHGRSPLIPSVFSYATFAEDAIGLLDFLGVSRISVVGWSDGAVTGLLLAMARPERIEKLFAFGANITPDGLKPNRARSNLFRLYADRCHNEYQQLSPHPDRWPQLLDHLRPMWRREPNLPWRALREITLPVAIAYGEYDEIIERDHSERMARELSNSQFVLLPKVSHFALLQDYCKWPIQQ